MNIITTQKLIRILYISVFLLLTGLALSASAAEDTDRSVPGVTAEMLGSKIKEAEAATNLDTETKDKLVELYRRSQTNLENLRSYEADAGNFAQARKTAPVETNKLLEELKKKDKLAPERSLHVSSKTSQSELEQLLQKEKADLAAVEAKLSELNIRLEIQASRPAAARERLIAAKKQQESLLADHKVEAPPGELPAMTKARQWVLETQAYAISAEIRKLDMELLSHQVRIQLLQAKQDVAESNVRFITARVRLLEDMLSKRRLAKATQAQQQTEAVKEELKGKHHVVRDLAEKNAALGEEITARALDLEKLAAEDEQTSSDAKRIGDELSTIRQKLKVAGLSQALGRVLMEQRRTLPDLASMRRKASKQEDLIASASLRQIQYGEERRRLRDIDDYIDNLTKDLPADEIDAIRGELHDLVSKRKALLENAISTEASYLRTLNELDLAHRQLIDVIAAYDDFLDKRLLWIRSTEPVSTTLFKNLPHEIARLFSPMGWYQTGSVLLRQLANSPLTSAAILALIVLSLLRKHFLQSVIATGEKIRRIRTDSYNYTLAALGWTVLASAPLPLLLMTIGSQLLHIPDAPMFSRAAGAGLVRMSNYFLLLLFFTDVGIAGGLSAKHFRWSGQAVAKLRAEFRLLMVLFLPAVFIIVHSITLDRAGYGGSLALIGVPFAIGAIGIFIFRAFTPQGGILAEYFETHPHTLVARLYPVWLGALIAAITGLIGLVLFGYQYTGGTLTRHLINTIWLIYFLILCRGLVVRWLLLVSRRLALQAILERREAARAAKETAAKTSGRIPSGDEESLEVDERQIDLAALDAHSRKLLNTAILFSGIIGLWLIWSTVIPAFGILDDISLWHHMALIDGVEQLVPITLADIALALIIGIVTMTAARGLPAILEFILLQRISITQGAIFTATTLLRYVIVGIGVILLFKILGGNWSQIQWLVAALGVGIGFGLQEIVANFFSGLIILFERPIRVGDIVTVGDTSGVVSRINIRATTITNWDRQELLVPNKEFITNRLLNWSLSDPITRIRVPVGIAYGSDVARALALMQEAADEHPNVLKDPPPILTFDAFGDNSLNLQLRAYLPSIENRLSTITELHEVINRKFNEAGIVISFPQRDVHLDTSGPIDVRLHRDPDSKGH